VGAGVQDQAVFLAGAEADAKLGVRLELGIELAGVDAVADGVHLGGRDAAPIRLNLNPSLTTITVSAAA
jgi:hypothetical protein